MTVLVMRRGDMFVAMRVPPIDTTGLATASSWADVMDDTADAEWCCVPGDESRSAKWPDRWDSPTAERGARDDD